MTDKDIRISDAELQLLQLLWEESPLGAVDIAARVPADREWSLTTVKTLLGRLAAKGAVSTEGDGRRFRYRPAIDCATVTAGQAGKLVDRLFGGRVSPLVAHLAQRQRLTDEDIAEIEALLRDLKA
ncbi:MAG TPA: BlaI/MecI/CopY family transcriptional regulator [Sphingomicrobium sp.]|nr:BlaI/MecI/CopY family transcriptional regulator [Sphingomicrobium sp.]